MQKIAEFYEDNLPHYLDMLHQMVDINSFTANPAGVNQLNDLTAEMFSELGFQSERVPSITPGFGDHLVMTHAGTGAGKVGLVSHLDTVFPPEEEQANDFGWRPEGEKIYGPGTVDIKGGTLLIYMFLEALKTHAPEVFEATTWVVLLNSSEETLSVDFGDLCLQYLSDAKACLVFEGGSYNDGAFKLVEARKGRASYTISVSGKASHAGVSHAAGANAIVQLAHTITAVATLTNYQDDLTFNVGAVQGGTVVNRVPHEAHALGEMRTFKMDVFEQALADLHALAGPADVTSNDGFRTHVAVAVSATTQPWSPNSATNGLIELWEAAASELGYTIEREARGGLSDGNHTWHAIPTIDGLGPAGGNAHASESSADGSKEQEYIYVPSIIPKAVLNYSAILKLVGND